MDFSIIRDEVRAKFGWKPEKVVIPEGKPIELGIDEFYDMAVNKDSNFVKTELPWFIKFYAPWDRDSKNLAPNWDALAESAVGHAHIAKVDCTSPGGMDLCHQIKIQEYPSLLFFSPGKDANQMNYDKYEGGTDLQTLIDFVVKDEEVKA